jgi:hypothetical protein
MDEVYGAMAGEERAELPEGGWPEVTGQYVDAIVTHALEALPVFGDTVARMIAGVYSQSPEGERFIRDPTRAAPASDFALFLDEDGHVVSVRNPDLVWKTSGQVRTLEMAGYQSYEVLTGALAGQRFDRFSRPLPSVPVYRSEVVVEASTLGEVEPERRDEGPEGGRVFLCHASDDKVAVRALYQRLRASGFEPWLDEEDLLPGQDWDREIGRALRGAQLVLVCLSQRSQKRGYLQKEIRRALDVAEEQPEGTIFLIPVRLEDCEVPERLRTWQWVDLYDEHGYSKLEAALRSAVRQVAPPTEGFKVSFVQEQGANVCVVSLDETEDLEDLQVYRVQVTFELWCARPATLRNVELRYDWPNSQPSEQHVWADGRKDEPALPLRPDDALGLRVVRRFLTPEFFTSDWDEYRAFTVACDLASQEGGLERLTVTGRLRPGGKVDDVAYALNAR